ncbi:MAG TPA: hypothetical protein DEG43_08365 [Acidimicrobiaceae bacterium]|jgi:hypothetical protein|nr:hypothetical protein [Acidimicrobiaceae bacterium]
MMENSVVHNNSQIGSSRFRGAGVLGLLVILSASGCYQGNHPTSYDAQAKSNFLAACTEEVISKNATTTVVPLADKDDCVCIYESISDTKSDYYLRWEDLQAFETKQAKAKEGEMPQPPKRLTKAITACTEKVVGPTVTEG